MRDNSKVMMLINTAGLSYDDRLRKECRTLLKLSQCVKIIALEYKNKLNNGVTEDNVPFQTISLFTRKILPHKRCLAFKTIEMYAHFIRFILAEKPDVLWIHNIEMAGLVPIGWSLKKLGLIKRLVWDQHELPAKNITNNRVLRSIFKSMLNLCDIIVCANRERRDFLLRKLDYGYFDRFKVIENFVDEKFYNLPHGMLSEKIKSWLGNHEYILAQGGSIPGRYLKEVVEAVMAINDIKLVVVGPFSEGERINLRAKYNNLDEIVFFTGWVKQLKLVNYIDNAVASIVLYNARKQNNLLCAANRLYQALSRGVPVIVGSNPPMKSLVESLGNGIILQYDGRDVVDIIQAIRSILENYSDYREKAIEHKRTVTWESQKMTISEVIGLTTRNLS